MLKKVTINPEKNRIIDLKDISLDHNVAIKYYDDEVPSQYNCLVIPDDNYSSLSFVEFRNYAVCSIGVNQSKLLTPIKQLTKNSLQARLKKLIEDDAQVYIYSDLREALDWLLKD